MSERAASPRHHEAGADDAMSTATLADDLALARAVAAAVSAVPGVAALSHGHSAGAATYGPGDTIHGVMVRRQGATLQCGIHLIARYPDASNLLALAVRVREVARQTIAACASEKPQRVDVAIDGLVAGEELP